jgi:hypothetical protein
MVFVKDHRVRRYIEPQEHHHRRVTFQDEYRSFLKQYGFEYNEHYVWNSHWRTLSEFVDRMGTANPGCCPGLEFANAFGVGERAI